MQVQDHDDEPPLDPAAERVRRRLARLLAGSLGIMILGLIAVFAAIVYRVGLSDGDASPEAGVEAARPVTAEQAAGWSDAAIALPAGSEIRSVALDGSLALLHVAEPGGQALLLVDLASGAVIARRPLVEAPEERDTDASQGAGQGSAGAIGE